MAKTESEYYIKNSEEYQLMAKASNEELASKY